MNNLHMSTRIVTTLLGGVVLAIATLMSIPTLTHAATYAYVDATGEVKSVIANDWMTAINTAPNIHLHSGVLLLNSASDYTIVGDNVSAF